MSHFTVLVITNGKKNVEQLLAPYDENGECFRDGKADLPASRWDWYAIGGRWTGMYSDYEPYLDPKNWSVCDLCGGTGFRSDKSPNIERHVEQGYKVVKMTAERRADLLPHFRKSFAGETLVPAFMAVYTKHRGPGWKGKPGALWEQWVGDCNGCSGSGASRNFHNREMDHGELCGKSRSVNVLPVKTILAKYADDEHTTHAVVTPDGKWHEQGEMGWFGTTRGPAKTENNWKAEWLKLLKEHKDLTATLVDAHV
jgi:hypothetical protein